MTKSLLVACLATLGCGGTTAPTCATVAAALAPEPVHSPGAMREPVGEIVAQHCERDGWSTEARACIVASVKASADEVKFTDISPCQGKLTAEQARSVGEDLAAQARSVGGELVAPSRDAGSGSVNLTPGTQLSQGSGGRALVIRIVDDGPVEIAGRSYGAAELDELLQAVATSDRDTQIVLRASRGVSHGAVVRVMERAKAAGLTRLAIGTD